MPPKPRTVQPSKRGRGAPPAKAASVPPTQKGSLERGLTLLRLFKPGIHTLGNGELADRSGMARSTVTRISHHLVAYGFLQKGPGASGYKLGPVVLSLAEAYLAASPILKVSQPLMRTIAIRFKIDVHLAMLDYDDMLYVAAIRHRKESIERRVRAGHRIPLELTSGGKAWLATLPTAEFRRKLANLKNRSPIGRTLRTDIIAARREFEEFGYCCSRWMAYAVALATPLEISASERFYVSFSVALQEATEARVRTVYGPALLELSDQIRRRYSDG